MANLGTKSPGLVWLLAIAAAALTIVVDWLAMKLSLPGSLSYILTVVFMGGGAAAACALTRAGKGHVIGAFIVGSLVLGIGAYMLAASAVTEAASALTGTMGAMAEANKDAQAAEAMKAAGGVFGALAGVLSAVVNFIIGLVVSIIGAVIGGKIKAGAGAAPGLRQAA